MQNRAWLALVPALVTLSTITAFGQTTAARASTRLNGKPNMTGLWQALGTADWDIQDHASHAGPFY
jgi:hypothetical protein